VFITINNAKELNKIKAETIRNRFFAILNENTLPIPVFEYQFHPKRKWRADYCWIDEKIILEVEGGVWTGGRHTRGSGFAKDMEKYNNAALLGFRLLRVTPQQLHGNINIENIRLILGLL